MNANTSQTQNSLTLKHSHKQKALQGSVNEVRHSLRTLGCDVGVTGHITDCAGWILIGEAGVTSVHREEPETVPPSALYQGTRQNMRREPVP